mgnify:FL=1
METNGTRSLANLPIELIKIVDVKTPGSGVKIPFPEENFTYINKQDNLKFVICSRKDFEWSVEICRRHSLLERAEVLFSAAPKQVDYRDLWEWILKEGLDIRFQPQLHKMIWENKTKGV